MKHQLEFTSDKSLEILQSATKQYFTAQGFKLSEENSNHLQFKRGSISQNMLTFNPLKWKSCIDIKFDNQKIHADFDINSTFQSVTKKDEQLWETFVTNYQKSIETDQNLIEENRQTLQNTQKSNRKYLVAALIGALVFGIPGGFIAYWSGIDIIAGLSPALGAMIFMMTKIEIDKNKA